MNLGSFLNTSINQGAVKMITDKRIEYEVERFNSYIIPFGSRDIYEAVSTALEGGHDGCWLGEQIEEYMESTDCKLDAIDPNYIAYDGLLQEARNDIDTLTDTDIQNDLSESVDVYGNCMCTSLDYSEEAKTELMEILKKIDEEDKTDAIKWLISEMD